MFPKAIGRVTNISPGPPVGSRPEANTIVKTARPHIRAARVSLIAIIQVGPGREMSLDK